MCTDWSLHSVLWGTRWTVSYVICSFSPSCRHRVCTGGVWRGALDPVKHVWGQITHTPDSEQKCIQFLRGTNHHCALLFWEKFSRHFQGRHAGIVLQLMYSSGLGKNVNLPFYVFYCIWWPPEAFKTFWFRNRAQVCGSTTLLLDWPPGCFLAWVCQTQPEQQTVWVCWMNFEAAFVPVQFVYAGYLQQKQASSSREHVVTQIIWLVTMCFSFLFFFCPPINFFFLLNSKRKCVSYYWDDQICSMHI